MGQKITHDEMKQLPKIIAIDFDGTLVEDCFPNIGAPNHKMLNNILTAQSRNPNTKWILWTCRTGEHLARAHEWCLSVGLKIDAVNRNVDEVIAMFGEDTRKVYADQYIDDKNGWLYYE